MNHFMNLKRSRWLLLTIFALLAGMPARGQVTEGFEYASDGTTVISVNDGNMGLSNGWVVVGSGNYVGIATNTSKDLQLRSGSYVYEGTYSIGSQYSSNTWLVCPVEVTGTIEFYARQYSSSKSMKVGLAMKDGDSFVISNSNFYTCSGLNSSFQKYTVALGDEPVYVAFKPSYAFFDNVTYTPYVKPSGPSLVVKDYDTNQKLTSPASYNFGLTTAGTIHYFLLTNPGTEDLGVTVSETGNFGAALSTTTVHAGGNSHVALTVTMPDATGSSEITITPESGSGIDPFVINVSGTVRDPNKVYLDFSDGQMPDGWTSVAIGSYASSYGSEWAASTGYVSQSGSSSSYEWAFTSPMLTFANGETIFFETQKYSSSTYYNPSIKVQYSTDGSTWTTIGSAFTDDTYDSWTSRSVTIPEDGVKYIRFSGWYIKLRNIYGGEAANEPNMKVTQPASLDYGVITSATQKTFTIANTGKATLEGINVTSSNSSIFAISGVPASLAAGTSAEVTITMDASTVGALNSDITVSATGMTDVVFTVTGVVLPDGMFVVDFNDNQLPAGWGNNASNKWSFSDGKAYCTSAAELTTPALQFSDGDLIAITITSYDDYDNNYIEITGSTDGSTWDAFTAKKYVSRSQIPYGSYTTLVVSDIPTTVKYLKFKGYYVRVDEIAGLTYAPVLSVTKDNVAVSTPDSYDFGECVADADVTYNFANTGAGTIDITNVAITGDGAAAYSTNWTTSVATPFDLVITRTYDATKAGAAQNAVVTVTTSEGDFVINVTGTDKAANAPEFAIFIDDVEQTTGADLGFGVITSNFGKPFTIQNNGTGALNVTAITLPDADYSTDLETAPSTESPLVVPAGGSKTVYVILTASAKAIKSGKNVVISAEGFEDFTLVADATVMPGATTIDFNNNALPDGWTNAASNKWSFDDGKAYCTAQSSSPAELVTKKLQFADDDFITISATSYDNFDDNYLEVLGSTDNGETWTAFETKKYISRSQIPYGSYATLVVDGIPSTVNKLKFRGYYVRIDEIAGLAYVDNDPTLAVYYNSEATSPVTSGTTDNFGWKKNSMGHVYYIKNDGTGTLTISDITVPEGFDYVTENDAMTVAAGADALPLTIIMMNETIGLKSGSVTLTTDGGNFEIPVKGFVYGDRNFVDFTDAAQYTGWTGVNVNSGVASLSSTAIQTTSLKATAGENLYVEMKGSSAYASKSFSYSYSNDNGETWSDAVALVASTYSSVADQVFTISNIADPDNESTVLIRFTGSNLGIDHIYGFEAIATPVMALDNADDHNFGMQTATAYYEIIVSNNGTANLENLAATLATGEDYETSVIATIVEPGSSTTIIVTQKYDASKGLASLSDVLTISADNVTPVTINLSGKTRDANKYFTDFEAGMPYGWTYTGWSRTSSGGNYYAQSDYSDLSTLRTPALTLAAGEEIKYDAWVGYTGGTFKVRYTLDGGISWTEQDVEATTTQTTKTLSLGNTEPVTAYIQFVGNYRARLDNFYGGSMNEEAPYIQVTQAGTAVENGTTEAFGTILAETSATYTITNAGGGTLTITEPIATTGDATAAVDVTSLAAGESATLTITMPVVAPYGEKSGAVTVTTSLGDFVINYTATTMDPDALNVDFSDDTMPAGWYKESGWTIYGQEIYRNLRTSDAYFMSQKLSVARTEDVLQFDAKTYGSYYASSAVLKVSYSTDRVNWTEVGDYAADMTASYKTFSISGLAAGEYYLKFEGRYASIDNIIGWKKVAGIEHDLYVTATNIPTTLAADYTATATVTSLLAAEEGVYAKLFFGDTEIATSEAANVALNGSTTFTMTATEAPEEALYEAKIVVYYSDGTVAFTTGTTTVGTLVLKETEAFAAAAGTYGEVKLNRTFNAGWNTVCLPFAAGYATTFFGEGAKAYAFTGYENGALKFERVYSLQAGVPYIVYVAEAFSEKTLTNVTITDEAAATVEFGGAILRGTYAPVAAGEWTKNLDNDVIYGVTPAGKIAKAGASASIKGFRAYFDLPAGAEVKAMLFDGDDATAIQRIDLDGAEDEVIYDLNGRRVNSNASGVLIINGKKVLKK